ncbi:glycosyltransferase [Leptospira sp. 96542]|nr:glycosyltransferase [Leptospira sp. 96542]
MVLFLTEYFKSNGLGHLRRCIAFSELFEDAGYATKIIINTDDSSAGIFESKYIINNWLINGNFENQYQAIIVDSYRAQISDYKKISEHTSHLVVIDDDNRIEYPQSCIIYNGGLGGAIYQYDPSKYKKILVGPEYSLLRKPFRNHKESKFIDKKISRVLITMGGSDPLNLTSKIINQCSSKFPDLNLDVIIGPGFKHFKENQFLKKTTVKFYRNLDATSMVQLMMLADLCITAGGQTIYELGKLGIPFIVIKTAENQQGNILGLSRVNIIDQYLDPNVKNFEHQLENLMQKLVRKTDRRIMSEKLLKIFKNKSLSIVDSIFN